MKSISNYCKSDQVVCFELPEPRYGEIVIKNHGHLTANDLLRFLTGDRVCHEFSRPIISAISVLISAFLYITRIRFLKTFLGYKKCVLYTDKYGTPRHHYCYQLCHTMYLGF